MTHRLFALLLLLPVPACAELDEPLADDTVADELLADVDWETQLAFYCPGIDRAAGVPTYRGLAGTYVRLGLPAEDEPYRLAFATVVDDPEAVGTFAGLRGTASGTLGPYAGAFRAIPDNPAIGPALGLDVGGDGRYDATHFVLGLRRSLSGATITRICLSGDEHPFLLVRTYF
ncbi:MAG: hypothetical protein F9K40_11505 [Kofleriaceae bacterium]|nr:MAG: hypothetical protein F9K40_11505 [Kofleriaceae bacterium]MBZ0232702.1 hypothetical protein [Kofleriaceae bacterium]